MWGVGGERTLDPSSITIDDDRLQELIRLVLLVPSLDGAHVVPSLRGLALPVHEPLDRNLHAVPALVPVHRIVPPDDRRDLSDAELRQELAQLARIARRGARRRVAPVAEEVHVHVRHADVLRGLEQRIQVRVVRVHAAVRDLSRARAGGCL